MSDDIPEDRFAAFEEGFDAGYKRGMEDAAKMCAARAKEIQQRSLTVSAFNELVEMAVAIRAAQTQED